MLSNPPIIPNSKALNLIAYHACVKFLPCFIKFYLNSTFFQSHFITMLHHYFLLQSYCFISKQSHEHCSILSPLVFGCLVGVSIIFWVPSPRYWVRVRIQVSSMGSRSQFQIIKLGITPMDQAFHTCYFGIMECKQIQNGNLCFPNNHRFVT